MFSKPNVGTGSRHISFLHSVIIAYRRLGEFQVISRGCYIVKVMKPCNNLYKRTLYQKHVDAQDKGERTCQEDIELLGVATVDTSGISNLNDLYMFELFY